MESSMANKLENKEIKVLDDGFVRLIDHMGNDLDICNAARISYGKGTKIKSDDRNLIRYMMRHSHTSPFQHVMFKFHVRVPMDTWRQWIRHRTMQVNEYSTRYSEAIDSQQKTAPDQWRLQSKDNKQGSDGFLDLDLGQKLTEHEEALHHYVRNVYNLRLEKGVAREQARKDLPLSTYTEAYITQDLHNLFHFLKLRLDSHAQYEIRCYAEAILELITPIVPIAVEAFKDYKLNAVTFSKQEVQLLSEALDALTAFSNFTWEEEWERTGLSKRELKEFLKKVGLV